MITLEDGSYTFHDFADSRGSTRNLSFVEACKLFRGHVTIYKRLACCVSRDGIELDPVEDMAVNPDWITSITRDLK